MKNYLAENLSHDPVHGYIPFVSGTDLPPGEVAEREIIDHPWVQRLRQIHQLQTAWYVYPTAEHTRFAHVVGVMHLASRAVAQLYPSLREICPEVPSRPYVELLLRMAGLLHDVGHGPFGHFFDDHFLRDFSLTHETVGAEIIIRELGPLLVRLKRTPNGELAAGEALDPAQVAWLITRPAAGEAEDRPKWLVFLRSLLSGIYTIDNLDFVLRDAYMSGYSQRAYDLDRLLHYTFFSERGLTIHDRGIDALLRFMGVRADLFRAVYFHRTVRAIDLTLADLFKKSKRHIFPGNPLEYLDDYREFTEAALLIEVARWRRSSDPKKRELGEAWRALLERRIPWRMAVERVKVYSENEAEQGSVFSDGAFVERKIREALPAHLADVPMRVDVARHIHRPHTRGPAAGQNFLYDSARQQIRPLTDHQLVRRLPTAYRVCRIYAETLEHRPALAAALDTLLGGEALDDLTNM